MGGKISDKDLAHLKECYEAYGIIESARNGHLTVFPYDSKGLREATKQVADSLSYVDGIYYDNVK